MFARILSIAVLLFLVLPIFSQSIYDYGVSITNNVPFNTIYDEPHSYFDWSAAWNTSLYDDDHVSKPTDIGFNFNYKGKTYSKFRASVNGFITFDTITNPSYTYSGWYAEQGAYTYDYGGAQFEVANATNLALAINYEDLVPLDFDNDSSMCYRVMGVSPNRILIIEWRNVQLYGGNITHSFQLKLHENNSKIDYQYENQSDEFSSPVVGINEDDYETNPQAQPEYLTLGVGQAANQIIAQTNNVNLINNIDTNTLITFQLGMPPCSNVANASNLVFTQVKHTEVQGKFNRSPNAEYYKIIRTETNVAPPENASSLKIGIDTIFTDIGLQPNRTYYYWVFAYQSLNCSGIRPIYNTVPITANATTLPCTFPSSTVNIGSTGAFTTLGAALNSIKNNGVSGAIVLQLQPSYNPTLETYPVYLKDSIPCMNDTNTITIRPGASVASVKNFTSSDTLSTFIFDSGSYFVFDGRPGGVGTNKYIQIENTSLSGNAIFLKNKSNFNTFKYCTLKGVNNKQDEGVINLQYIQGNYSPSFNTFSYCNMSDGSTTPTNLLYSKGYTSGNIYQNVYNYYEYKISMGNTVEFCNLSNFFNNNNYCNGIKLVEGNGNWVIKNSSFYQTANRTVTGNYVMTAINIGQDKFGYVLGGDHEIRGNYIGGSQALCAGNKLTVSGGGQFVALNINSHGYIQDQCSYNPWGDDDCYPYIFGTNPTYVDSNVIKNIAVNSNTTINSNLIHLGSGDIYFSNNTIGGANNADSIKIYCPTSPSCNLMTVDANGNYIDDINILNNTFKNIHLTSNGKANIIYANDFVERGNGFIIQNNNIGDSTAANNNITINAPSESGVIRNECRVNDAAATTSIISDNRIFNVSELNTSPGFTIIYDLTYSPQIYNNVLKNCIANTAISTSDYLNGIVQANASSNNITSAIKNNIIENIGINSNAIGAKVIGIYANTGTIELNKVNGLFNNSTSIIAEVRGIQFGNYAVVKNNSIRLGLDYNGNNLSSGIIFSGLFGDTYGTISSKILNNTIYLGGTNTSDANTYCLNFKILANPPQEVYNNIFVNERINLLTGRSYCVNYFFTGNLVLNSYLNTNRNLYFTSGTGTGFGRVQGSSTTSFTTLQAWRNYIKEDTLSCFYNPNFINATGNANTYNLHLNSPTAAESLGKSTSAVPFDIDNESRNSATPDVGMDEGNFTAVDVTQPIITYTPFGPSCTASGRILEATITDVTGVPVAGSTRPRIYYRKNNIGNYFDRVGTLQSGNGQSGDWDFPIIAADMGGLVDGDIVSYFVVAQDLSAQNNFGSYPFGAFGPYTDSITYGPFTVFNYIVSSASTMGGNYNVGIGQTYTTIEAAVNAYNNACIQDDIVFLLTDSIYTISVPITINNNTTASESSTLTISPTKTNTVVSGASTGSLILFNAAKHVSINGNIGSTQSSACDDDQPLRHLTIKNTSTGSVVGFTNSSIPDSVANCVIENCILLGNGTSSTAGVQIYSTTSSTNIRRHRNIMVRNNAIGGVAVGISAIGLSTSFRSNDLYIQSNQLNLPAPNNIRNFGVGVNNFNNIEITKNKISRIRRSDLTDVAAILVGVNNTEGISLNSAGNANSYANFKISGNEIDSIVSTGQASAIGIYIAYQNLGFNIIDNNMISHVSSNANNTGSPSSSNIAAGIYTCNVIDNDTFLIVNNTVVMQGTIEGTIAATGYSSCLYTTNNDNVNIKNNIFINVQKGNAGATCKMYSMLLYLASIESDFLCDNNNLYSKASGPGTYNIVGHGTVTSFDTLAEWQLYANRDTLSRSQLALFKAHNNLRLKSHIFNNGFDNNGVPFSNIVYDIDCNERSNTYPDIGADEFVSCTLNSQNSLAGNQGSSLNVTQDVNMSSYYHDECKPIAYIEPALVNPVRGNIDVTLTLSDTNLFYNGRTLAKRYYDISPHNSPNFVTAKVTLYYTQEEFDWYNAQNGDYLELPTSITDTIGMKNIRIMQYHGVSYNGLPDGYNGRLVELDPATTAVQYIANLQAWAVTINVYGFSGFFISSAAPVCRTSNIQFVSNIIGTNYQWQVNTGNGYTNLVNGGLYSGVTNDTITIASPPTAYRSYKYRCVVNGNNGQENELLFSLKWKGIANVNWSNANNWGCSSVPDIYTDVLIDSGTPFSPQVNVNAFARTLKLTPGVTLQVNNPRTLKVEQP